MDKTISTALDLFEEEVHLILMFGSADEAEAAFDRMAAALRDGTGFTVGKGKPVALIEVDEQ